MQQTDLLARLEALERKVSRMEDRAAIENLMGRYQYLHTANMELEVLDQLFAHVPDATIEDRANGVYQGYFGLGIPDYYAERYGIDHYMPQELIPDDMPPMPPAPPAPPRKLDGVLVMHTLTTPVIEVAADGNTARGVWTSVGCESGAYREGELSHIPRIDNAPPGPDGLRAMADWVWLKYGVDFLKVDGQWKIWHLHIYDVFRCPFDENWVTFAQKRFAEESAADSRIRGTGTTPWLPTTFHYQYTPDAVSALEPKPPLPYESMSEEDHY